MCLDASRWGLWHLFDVKWSGFYGSAIGEGCLGFVLSRMMV